MRNEVIHLKITFDLDQTLLDTSASIITARLEALEAMGLSAPLELVETNLGVTLVDFWRSLGRESSDYPTFELAFDNAYSQHFLDVGVDPEVLSALVELKSRQSRFGIVSNKRMKFLAPLVATKLPNIFEFVVSAADRPGGKAVAILNSGTDYYVGDARSDWEACTESETGFIGFTYFSDELCGIQGVQLCARPLEWLYVFE